METVRAVTDAPAAAPKAASPAAPKASKAWWLLAAALALPHAVEHTRLAFVNRSLGLVGLYMLLALGLNFTLGFTGLFDLGYIAIYGVGAYSGAWLSIHGVSFWLCVPAAVAAALVIRFIEGVPILRLRGDYLAIVTMGFGEITRLVLNNWDAATNGPNGLPRIGEAMSPIRLGTWALSRNDHFVYLIAALVALTTWASFRLEDSRIGRAWVAIREDETAAELAGVPVRRMKLLAFLISAVPAAVAGVVFAHWETFISPESFVFWESILVVSMIVVGGMGSITGVLLGALFLGGAPQVLQAMLGGSSLIAYRYLLFGLLLVVIVIYKPEGLWPSKRRQAELHEAAAPELP